MKNILPFDKSFSLNETRHGSYPHPQGTKCTKQAKSTKGALSI